MRDCTDFCAPCPRATMVIMAATPMMMPSMVSADRNRWLRRACIATRITSFKSMLSLRRTLSASLLLLLLHAGNAATTGHALNAFAHFFLRIDERRAWQHDDFVAFVQSFHDFNIVKVGEAGLDVHSRWLTVAFDEYNVAPAQASRAEAARSHSCAAP